MDYVIYKNHKILVDDKLSSTILAWRLEK